MDSRKKAAIIVAGATCLAAVTLAVAVTQPSFASTTHSRSTHTLTVWFGGTLAFATPGSPGLKWFNQQVKRLQKKHPGWKVQTTILSTNMDQLIAKMDAAAASHTLPDLIDFFSGTYTTNFEKVLQPLNHYISPKFYSSMSNWNLSCANQACNGGKSTIYGVPMNYYSYMLYYNKALFKKAGISAPPKSYKQLYSDCAKLKQHKIIPFVYGDRDGYTTDNLLNVNLASYLTAKQIRQLVAGKLKFTDPRIVSALSAIVKLHSIKCVSPDATTHEQTDATGAFASGKGAMVEIYTALVPSFEKALGKKLGTAPLPQSGPKLGKVAGSSGDNWVIPKQSQNASVAWDFIKLMSDKSAGLTENRLIGQASANKAAAAAIKDKYIEFVAKYAAHPAIPNMDLVISNKAALTLYKEAQLAFSGQKTPLQALQTVQQVADTHAP